MENDWFWNSILEADVPINSTIRRPVTSQTDVLFDKSISAMLLFMCDNDYCNLARTCLI